jgi:hypothetical protein
MKPNTASSDFWEDVPANPVRKVHVGDQIRQCWDANSLHDSHPAFVGDNRHTVIKVHKDGSVDIQLPWRKRRVRKFILAPITT